METGVSVKKKRTARPADSLRLDPENRLCSQWDATSIRKFQLASWERMGFQVLDDFCQEHIM
ncbi:hypothetical protein [Vermiculatibacterium agrestimuris]|uniref:hypothetical protein n=1 Tax=Vermiculatibacterium agrestimuris TaxID=2941519 RepID=UPI00203D8521|nr:hypothetical protein [Vermiculatibacterium agrestimuris]